MSSALYIWAIGLALALARDVQDHPRERQPDSFSMDPAAAMESVSRIETKTPHDACLEECAIKHRENPARRDVCESQC